MGHMYTCLHVALNMHFLLSSVALLACFVLGVWHLSYKSQPHIYLVPKRGGRVGGKKRKKSLRNYLYFTRQGREGL